MSDINDETADEIIKGSALDRCTPKQREFVTHYLDCFNYTEAAKRAGYQAPNMAGPRMARQSAVVREAIKEAISQKTAHFAVDTSWVLNEFIEAAMIAKQDLKVSLSSKTGKPEISADGEAIMRRDTTTLVKSLENIAKILGAYKAELEQPADASDFSSRIADARSRVLTLIQGETGVA